MRPSLHPKQPMLSLLFSRMCRPATTSRRSHRSRSGRNRIRLETRHTSVALLLAFCWACAENEPPQAADDSVMVSETSTVSVFLDATEASGLQTNHVNGATGELYMMEVMGAGAALFDFDQDGDLDVYLVQSGDLTVAGSRPVGRDGKPAAQSGRLWRNDLHPGTSLRFTDVTAESGLHSRLYGMGVAVGDVDNDGAPDLLITGYDGTELWRNLGDGTFADVTVSAGLRDDAWNTSASFVDIDRDGHLDLFIARYLDYNAANHRPCFHASSAKDYCGPSHFPPRPDRLLRNQGGGRFEDITVKAGLGAAYGPGLGTITADVNNDGWPDLYTANDATENQLWINQQDGTFRDEALLAGCAVNGAGQREASMGLAAGDVDGDGDEDLFMTHLDVETNTLYVNLGSATFDDGTRRFDLAQPSRTYTSFGTGWLDYDNDGWKDLLVVNGAVKLFNERAAETANNPLAQHNQLFRNHLGQRFEDVTTTMVQGLLQADVSRGAAFGDIDNDGDTDVLITNNAGAPQLLINQLGNHHSWIGLRLLDGHGRDALGAQVMLQTNDGRQLWRRVATDGSYASAKDPRVLIGLGEAQAEALEVLWPDGLRESWPPPQADGYSVLTAGTGRALGDR